MIVALFSYNGDKTLKKFACVAYRNIRRNVVRFIFMYYWCVKLEYGVLLVE